LTLKADVAKKMGSLFGKDTEKLFLEYYDENKPEDFLCACKEMITKMLGPDAAKKHCAEMTNKYPQLKKLEVYSR
jgi:hypothetical protein